MRDVTIELAAQPPVDVIGILDELDAAAPLLAGPVCGVTTAVERIASESEDLAGKVRQRVDDERVPATAVAEILTARTGVKLSSQTVRRHRRRGTASGCRCTR